MEQKQYGYNEYDDDNSSSRLFLGIIQKRYVKTLHGAVHGISALLALILGNYLCVTRLLLGLRRRSVAAVGSRSTDYDDSNGGVCVVFTFFFVSNMVSSLIILFFFWNKIQSWQLSTTSMKDKGLIQQQIQNFNRARGVTAQLQASLYPLVVTTFPQDWLESNIFSNMFALVQLILVVKTYVLLRDYGKKLILVYGFINVGLSIAIISHGSIATLSQEYSHLLDVMENDAIFVITSVQFGYMWYYLYSRNAVSKTLVQKMCKTYHVTLTCVYFCRVHYDGWYKTLPKIMWLHPILISIMAFKIFQVLYKTIFHQLQQKQQVVVVQEETKESSSPPPINNNEKSCCQHSSQSPGSYTKINYGRRSSLPSSNVVVLKNRLSVCSSHERVD